jgi:hypothetical protein
MADGDGRAPRLQLMKFGHGRWKMILAPVLKNWYLPCDECYRKNQKRCCRFAAGHKAAGRRRGKSGDRCPPLPMTRCWLPSRSWPGPVRICPRIMPSTMVIMWAAKQLAESILEKGRRIGDILPNVKGPLARTK